jgi:thioredoxin-related protein
MRAPLCLVFALLAAAAQAAPRDVESYFFQPALGDFKVELASAKHQGKAGVFLFFEMDDCPWCARMKANVLNQSEVQDYYRQHFLVYSVDVKGDLPITDFVGHATTEKAFALDNRVRATPTMLFIDPDGKIVTRYTGPTRDASEMLLLGHYVVDQVYLKMPFTQYKQAPPITSP